MKTSIIPALLLLLLQLSASQPLQAQKQNSPPAQAPELSRQDYTVMNTVTGVSRSNRIWILFIPFGGKSETKRREQAYRRAIAKCGCDGLLQPVYSERKVPVPLIVVSYFHRKTTVSGKGYRIKVDSVSAER